MAISKIGSKALVDCSVAAVDIEDNSITSAKLAGSIANAKLANSSITVNGTSVSLGASGSIPAVSWQSVITAAGSSNTAVAGQGYFIDTTSDVHTVTLPASATAGDTIAIKDYAGTFGTNNLTIARNGHNIQGVANDSSISTNRASITLVYVDATKGWLYAVESNVADLGAPLYVTATGGTITTSGNFKIHSFTGDGCFVVSCGGNPLGSTQVDYLVVAGGGGSGIGGGGGGGAGGFRESCGGASGCYTASPLANPCGALPVSAQSYPITVGGGGAGTSSPEPPTASPGSNSIFSTITSSGGGGSTRQGITPTPSGGSGAGATAQSPGSGGSGNTPPVSPPQGNSGGSAPGIPEGGLGGGGGGATQAGSNSTPSPASAGPGGAGATTSISGSPTIYAGGGGGGSDAVPAPGGSAGPGGGGTGGGRPDTSSTNGTTNTGGRAGGLGSNAAPGTARNGGSGIVIIRYKYQ
jgi:hypothetical protein